MVENKPVVSWEWLSAHDIFDRLIDRLPLDPESREFAMGDVNCGETEQGVCSLIYCAEGEIPYEVYLELELNRDVLTSFGLYLDQAYEEMLERCTVADPINRVL